MTDKDCKYFLEKEFCISLSNENAYCECGDYKNCEFYREKIDLSKKKIMEKYFGFNDVYFKEKKKNLESIFLSFN